MLVIPFFSEIPNDLGHDAAWLDREVMRTLMELPQHQPFGNHKGTHHDHHKSTPSTDAPVYPRDRSAESAPG